MWQFFLEIWYTNPARFNLFTHLRGSSFVFIANSLLYDSSLFTENLDTYNVYKKFENTLNTLAKHGFTKQQKLGFPNKFYGLLIAYRYNHLWYKHNTLTT